MPLWLDDTELFALIRRELYTAVVGDIMDQLGLQHQFLSPRGRRLRDDMFLVGRAMPVLEADWCEGVSASPHNYLLNQPFGMMLEALDDHSSE